MMGRNFISRAFAMMRARRSTARSGYTGPVLNNIPDSIIKKKGSPIPPRYKVVHQEKKNEPR